MSVSKAFPYAEISMSWLVVELKSSAGSAPVLKSAQNYSEKPAGCLQCRFDKSVLEEWDWLSKEGRATGNVPVTVSPFAVSLNFLVGELESSKS